MFRHYLSTVFSLLLLTVLAAPAALPQAPVWGPQDQRIINTWFVQGFKNGSVMDIFQLPVPLNSLRYNVQELHCYNYSLANDDVITHNLFNCAVMQWYAMAWVGGGRCQFIDDWGKPYELNRTKASQIISDYTYRRLRTVCCGDDCKYWSPVMSPPAWYLKTGSPKQDPTLNPGKLAIENKMVDSRISAVLNKISDNTKDENDKVEGVAV